MKIEGPSKTSQTSSTKKKGAVGGGDSSFGDLLSSGTSEAAPSGGAGPVTRVDMLLMAQAVEDPTEGAARRRMQERADNILKELDEIRVALLTGTLSVGHLLDIADVIASHRERIMDPRLTALLDEVDLRAQIEIAKMRMAVDQR